MACWASSKSLYRRASRSHRSGNASRGGGSCEGLDVTRLDLVTNLNRPAGAPFARSTCSTSMSSTLNVAPNPSGRSAAPRASTPLPPMVSPISWIIVPRPARLPRMSYVKAGFSGLTRWVPSVARTNRSKSVSPAKSVLLKGIRAMFPLKKAVLPSLTPLGDQSRTPPPSPSHEVTKLSPNCGALAPRRLPLCTVAQTVKMRSGVRPGV
jgi:hypothetical protein